MAVYRGLPTAASADGTAVTPSRTGPYLEAMTLPLGNGMFGLGDEGSVFTCVNATTGTGIAGHAAPVVAERRRPDPREVDGLRPPDPDAQGRRRPRALEQPRDGRQARHLLQEGCRWQADGEMGGRSGGRTGAAGAGGDPRDVPLEYKAALTASGGGDIAVAVAQLQTDLAELAAGDES